MTNVMDAQRHLRLVTDDQPALRIAACGPTPLARRPGPFRFVSTEENVAPLRQAIVRSRQAIVDAQRDDGSFRCAAPASPRDYATFILLHAYCGRLHNPRVALAATSLWQRQLPSGGWSRDEQSGDDLGTTVLAYFALKLEGEPLRSPLLKAARRQIHHLGGADVADAATRQWLAALGQVSYDICAEAPESTAAREAYVGRRCRELSAREGVRELYLADPQDWPARSWPDATPESQLQEAAWKHVAELTTTPSQTEEDFAPLLDSFVQPLSNGDDDQVFALSSGDAPLLDTAAAIAALSASGLEDESPAVAAALDWLDAQLADDAGSECTDSERRAISEMLADRHSVTRGALPPALQLNDGSESRMDRRGTASVQRATDAAGRRRTDVEGLLKLQRPDGSWHALPAEILVRASACSPVPSTATALRQLGTSLSVDRNGKSAREAIAAGANWLAAAQNADGGWSHGAGEPSWRADEEPPTDLAITADVVLALLAAGVTDHDLLDAAIECLIENQLPTGDWPRRDRGDVLLADDGIAAADLTVTLRVVTALSRWASVDAAPQPRVRSPVVEPPALAIAPLTTAP
ncbi:MAG: hypothetical protein DWQ31_12885 [Planctomycetota bacterium]|nr:MAG: hypothetical protein DWQ31_12885 [Planctomycetota bacterium]